MPALRQVPFSISSSESVFPPERGSRIGLRDVRTSIRRNRAGGLRHAVDKFNRFEPKGGGSRALRSLLRCAVSARALPPRAPIRSDDGTEFHLLVFRSTVRDRTLETRIVVGRPVDQAGPIRGANMVANVEFKFDGRKAPPEAGTRFGYRDVRRVFATVLRVVADFARSEAATGQPFRIRFKAADRRLTRLYENTAPRLARMLGADLAIIRRKNGRRIKPVFVLDFTATGPTPL